MLASTLFSVAVFASDAPPLQCGVASAAFSTNPAAAAAAVQTGKLSFWWNWNTITGLDSRALNTSVLRGLGNAFVPMIWGTAGA